LPLFTQYLRNAPQGTFIRESGIDGVLRVVAYRQLPSYPDLVVAVGSGYNECWRLGAAFAALIAAVWLRRGRPSPSP
jgi:hypothetical protein